MKKYGIHVALQKYKSHNYYNKIKKTFSEDGEKKNDKTKKYKSKVDI